jgi:serine protease AprX
MDKTRLPIKVITPGGKDWGAPKPGGSPSKIFGDVDKTFRDNLIDQLGKVGEYFSRSFEDYPSLPAVAVVKLHEDALAKSHRPDRLLRGNQCPIIGSRRTGELLIAVQRRSLDVLASSIRSRTSRPALASISTISEIAAYTTQDALQVKAGDAEALTVKLRPFQHSSAFVNDALRGYLGAVLESLGVSVARQLNCYGPSPVYRLEGLQMQQLIGLAAFPGTRSLAEFPIYRVLRTASRRLGPATKAIFAAPLLNMEYPVLGLVDSGIDPNSALMKPWVAARMWAVAASDCDHSHGTFVGALAIHPRQLNNHNTCFPIAPCMILDVVAFPASGELPEDELLQAIEDALRKHPEVRVWNLSLSSNIPCDDTGFSDLAMRLDELQDESDVTFVIATGNYATPPFRGWPAENLGEDDRIGSPGDSSRGLTVGSIAHLESTSSRVRCYHPSPFSRRGPGAAFLPKPEVTHYAGNCDANGNCIQIGVVSLDGSGYLVEDIGTSYAAPLVASTLATIHSEAAERMSTNLAKALLIHSAVLSRETLRESDRAYFGFGVPGAVPHILSCSGSSVTLVFEPELWNSTYFEKTPFPYPSCLRLPNGAAFGDVMMTLVYDPPLDSAWGLEYCRANVEVSLGSFDRNNDGKREHKRLIPPDETDYKKLYERELVRNGFKWSPVKVYRRRLSRVTAETWRLTVSAEFRKEFRGERVVRPALVITISDPEGRLPVYDEVVVAAQQQGWIMDDLKLRQRFRASPTSSAGP